MRTYTCIVIDDLQTGLDLMKRYIDEMPELICLGYETMPLMVLEMIRTGKLIVDLIILDIDMPGISGLEFAAEIKGLARVIFVTGHEKYALKSFELNPVDYLLKPVSPERFKVSVERFKNQLDGKNGDIIKLDSHFFIRSSDKPTLMKIVAQDVICVEVKGDELTFHLTTGAKTISGRLKDFADVMDDFPFVRINRSYIINMIQIDEVAVNFNFVHMPGQAKINVGRNYKDNFEIQFNNYNRIITDLRKKGGNKNDNPNP